MRGRSEHLIDRAARGAAEGMSRRELVKLGAGAAAAAYLPSLARPGRASAAKTRGLCPTPSRGTCPDGLKLGKWKRGAKIAVPSGVPSRFNGCGPEAGVTLPVIGKIDPVPDKPLNLANFFEGCKAHDCCYGTCNSNKAQCDQTFLAQSLKACRDAPRDPDPDFAQIKYHDCTRIAKIYYQAVSSPAGDEAWASAQETACFACEDCEADLLNDPKNCGACGKICAPGLSCCLGDCKDTQVDKANCGACGAVCRDDQRCIGGQCIGCQAPLLTCGTACCDPDTEECVKGVCEQTCKPEETKCGPKCCTSDQICKDGTCQVPFSCPENHVECSGACCNEGAPCVDGICGHVCAGGAQCGPRQECCAATIGGAATICCPPDRHFCEYDISGRGRCLA